MSDWEAQLDAFLSTIKDSWAESRAQAAAGVGLGKRTERALFPIRDPEILGASDEFFACLAVFTPVSDRLDSWQKGISALAGELGANAETWGNLFAAEPAFAAAAPAFSETAIAVARAREALSAVDLARFRAEIVAPMKGELARIDGLRSRALRLQYKVEQLEGLEADGGFKKFADKANLQCLENARAALAVAKPVFLQAVAELREKFAGGRAAALTEFEAIREGIIAGVGELVSMEMPPAAPIDFGEIDGVFAAAKPA